MPVDLTAFGAKRLLLDTLDREGLRSEYEGFVAGLRSGGKKLAEAEQAAADHFHLRLVHLQAERRETPVPTSPPVDDKPSTIAEVNAVRAEDREEKELRALLGKAGDSDSFVDNVRWALRNAEVIIKRTRGGPTQYLWRKATDAPPGPGAIAYVRMAENNPAKFYSEIVPKALGKEEASAEQEMPVRDRKVVGKFKQFLADFQGAPA